MQKINKITQEDIQKEYKKISKLSLKEKDLTLAFLSVAVDRLKDIVRAMLDKKIKQSTTISDIKEIEDILSLGPSWFNYTRKVKKKN
jgi:hypothetical protein